MKKRSFLRGLLSLMLLGAMLLLCACPGGEPPITEPPTPGGDPGETEGEDNVIYGNGLNIEAAGDTIPEDAAVLAPVTYDETAAQDVPAGNFFRVAANAFGAGKVFRATGDSAARLSGQESKTYNGKGSVLLLPTGLEIDKCAATTLKDMVIVGNITITGSSALTFENVKVMGNITVDKKSADVTFTGCRLTGETALDNKGNNVTVLYSYVGYTVCGVKDSGAGLTVQNSRLEGDGSAVISTGTDVAVRNNTITAGEKDTAISLEGGTVNGLVALNAIRVAQQSVRLDGVYNTVVVMNSLISVHGENSTHLYVCDNQMGGRLTAKNNNYLLADGNTYPADELNHAAILANNENTNGDTLMDVNARLEVGADENLLPHVDKEQFVGMPRKETVKDVTAQMESPIAQYVDVESKNSEIVIIAPGAYATDDRICFTAANKNTTLYGYGVYMEKQEVAGQVSHNNLIACESTENVTVKGITVGYEQQSCHQVYVLEKLSGGKVLAVTGAGMLNIFGNLDPAYAHESKVMYLLPQSNGYNAVIDTGFTSIVSNRDGTLTIGMEADSYDIVQPGDVLATRFTTQYRSVNTTKSANITYKDLTVYGATSCLCCYESQNTTAVTYYRFADTTQNGVIIDEETYARYAALELEYGVDLEISQDEQKRFRGSPAHLSSIDGIQAAQCAQGSQVTSSLFENMCDDGTLQKGNHSRLYGIEENADGKTVTIYYKGNGALTNYKGGKLARFGGCAPIRENDRVYIYTAEGQLIYDGKAIEAGVQTGTKPASFDETMQVPLLRVVVEKEGLNPDYQAILATCDLEGDHPDTKGKVLVDNMSRSCNGFLFDNVVVQGIRTRGLLIKASDGTIKNCTFRNCAKLGIAIIYEIYYGESGVSENLLIKNNLIDNVGYGLSNNGLYLHYPINISGLGGGTVQEDFLLYKNILIEGNVIRRRHNEYAVYIQAAQGVTLKNNDFGSDGTDENCAKAVLLNGAMNITLEGNIFSPLVSADMQIEGDHYKNINGSDVMFGDIPLYPDKE